MSLALNFIQFLGNQEQSDLGEDIALEVDGITADQDKGKKAWA